jgi:hypothetical protein
VKFLRALFTKLYFSTHKSFLKNSRARCPNKEIAASVLGGATLVGMVTAFIAGKTPAEKTT